MISIDSIIRPGNTRAYLITNADGKCWLLPASGIGTALELYQPSGLKGKALKRLFPLLHRVPQVRKVAGATVIYTSLRPDITEAAEKAFGKRITGFSIFGGTPSVHQKITLQLVAGSDILGYCKLTDSPDIAALFSHEQWLLQTLHEAGMEDVPHCMKCGTLADGTHIFIQSTTKTRYSYSPHRFMPVHEQFLQDMARCTGHTMRFEESDLGKSLTWLRCNINSVPAACRDTISRNLDQSIAALSGNETTYSAFHADFTPWNMFIERDRLFVFDWEYARMSYPPMLDRYHFHVQQSLHVAHHHPRQIMDDMKRQAWFSHDEFSLYLLDIISRYLHREKGQPVSGSLTAMLTTWTELLDLNSCEPA